MEDALYEIASTRLFAKLSLDLAITDRTTIMNFRHRLERHQLARQLFDAVNQWFSDAGIMMKQGTLVDATLLEAPCSTKNKRDELDPEIHQTKKGNLWYFGMKAHIGVDAKSGLTHSLETTAANECDLNQWDICFMARRHLCSPTPDIRGQRSVKIWRKWMPNGRLRCVLASSGRSRNILAKTRR